MERFIYRRTWKSTMDLLRLVEAAKDVQRTPFWNDVAYLASSVEHAIWRLRCEQHSPATTFGELLPKQMNSAEKKLLEQLAERYLSQTTNHDTNGLRSGATPVYIGLEKTLTAKDREKWEWYYSKKHVVDWQILALNGKVDDAYTGMVHFLGAAPDHDDNARAHLKRCTAEAFNEPFLKVIRGLWRELYAGMCIHENPELLVQLAATAASKRRGWNKKYGTDLKQELALDGVSVDLFQYLTNRDLAAEQEEKTRAQQPATVPAPQTVQVRQPTRPRPAQSGGIDANDIGAAVDAIDRGERPQPRTPTEARTYTEPYVLQNIRCVGSDGNVFEQYAELRVQSDVVRQGNTQNSSHRSFTPYNAILHFESAGEQFLPSMALSCNVLVGLFRAAVQKNDDGTYTTLDEHAKQILDQYKNYGSGYGWHAQNTVVDWKGKGILRRAQKSEITHYPHKEDFPEHGGNAHINLAHSKILKPFNNEGFKNCTLEEACQKPTMLAYLQDFTGLQNPAELGEVAKYFDRTVKTWVSSENKTRAAWLGCGNINSSFSLDASSCLYGSNAARGVASNNAP